MFLGVLVPFSSGQELHPIRTKKSMILAMGPSTYMKILCTVEFVTISLPDEKSPIL